MGDTSAAAQRAQLEALRRLGAGGRIRIAAELSEAALQLSVDGVRRLHPDYTVERARRAVLAKLWGEAFTSRVFPNVQK